MKGSSGFDRKLTVFIKTKALKKIKSSQQRAFVRLQGAPRHPQVTVGLVRRWEVMLQAGSGGRTGTAE